MKKFFTDNLWWMVIVAIAVGGFALYRTYAKKESEETASITIQKES